MPRGCCVTVGVKFLPTPSARRATSCTGAAVYPHRISTHALREEGDVIRDTITGLYANFYPRPPRGGRLETLEFMLCSFQFLPTPSARRATDQVRFLSSHVSISSHALREEGDHKRTWTP